MSMVVCLSRTTKGKNSEETIPTIETKNAGDGYLEEGNKTCDMGRDMIGTSRRCETKKTQG
jgi:hypothetical protein